jgi:phage terminase small subunit
MGGKNSGRRSAPHAMKVIRGVTRKDRLNPHEPKITPARESFDVPPPELDGDDVARGYWTRVVPMLRHMGLVSELEREPLIALCEQWSRYRAGRLDPSSAAADKALDKCHRLWLELGFTPSGRTKMIALVTPEPVTAKWAGML